MIAATACNAKPDTPVKLFGVEPVKQCLQSRNIRLWDFGRELMVLGGPQARAATGTMSFFTTTAAARAKTRERRRALQHNPVWTIRNLSLVGLGHGIYRLVSPCLGNRQLVAPTEVMQGISAPPTVAVGVPARVLPRATAAQGWKTVAARSANKSFEFNVNLNSRVFRAFAVAVATTRHVPVKITAALTCAQKDGGAGSEPVRYDGPSPVVLELLSGNCTHDIPPNVWVRAEAPRPGTVAVRILKR